MQGKALFLFVMILISTCISGCSNRRELNELGIAMGMGIDKIGKNYKITVQLVNPGEINPIKGGGGRSPVNTFEATGNTMFEAVRRLTTVAPRKVYFAHLRMVVIGEDLAKQGIGKILDFMSRNPEFRTDFFIVISRGTRAENILKVMTPVEKIPTQQIFNKLQTSEKAWAATRATTLADLIKELTSKGKKAPVVTGLRIQGVREKGYSKENVEMIDVPVKLTYTGLAVFNKDKLIGWLNEDESQGYNYTQGKVKNTIEDVAYKEGMVGIEIIQVKENIQGKVRNGKPQVIVEVQVTGNISDIETHNLDVTKIETIDELENQVEQDIKRKIEQSIKKAQEELKVDIFGFGSTLERDEPEVWEKLEQLWFKEFPVLSVEVKVEAKIKQMGTITNSLLKDIE